MSDPATYHRSAGRGLDIVAEPDLRRIADYWCSKRLGRAMPGRSDIDPIEIPWALSRFYLVDFERATETYRYRVAGYDIEKVFERFSGRKTMRDVTLDEMLPPDSAALVRERWRPLAEQGAIVYMTGLIYLAADRIPVGARLMLPLADDGDDRVTGFIGFTECSWRRPTELKTKPQLDIWHVPLAELDGAAPARQVGHGGS